MNEPKEILFLKDDKVIKKYSLEDKSISYLCTVDTERVSQRYCRINLDITKDIFYNHEEVNKLVKAIRESKQFVENFDNSKIFWIDRIDVNIHTTFLYSTNMRIYELIILVFFREQVTYLPRIKANLVLPQ